MTWPIGFRNPCRRASTLWRPFVGRDWTAIRMLTSDFKEFAALLNAHGVEYLVVGGYALAAHGRPRYTGDLDFWVGPGPGNARR